jgi:adenylate kinase family enzyme
MKRAAVFGNAGGGKSTLAKRPANLTRHHLMSKAEMKAFLNAIRRGYGNT